MIAGDNQRGLDRLRNESAGLPVSTCNTKRAQALAAHIALVEGDPLPTIISLVELLVKAGIILDEKNSLDWMKKLEVETWIIRAWLASNRTHYDEATRNFLKAIRLDPVLLTQRRTLSPTIRNALLSYRVREKAGIDRSVDISG